jgi:hypothetical protein
VRGFVVRAQQIAAEVALEVAPDRVHVVRAILRAVALDDKRSALGE